MSSSESIVLDASHICSATKERKEKRSESLMDDVVEHNTLLKQRLEQWYQTQSDLICIGCRKAFPIRTFGVRFYSEDFANPD